MRQRQHQHEDYTVHHLRRLLREVARGRLGSYLASLHAADIANAMARMDADERETLWPVLSLENAARVLELCPQELQQELVDTAELDYVVKIIAKMSPDDAVDVLGDADEETREALVNALPDVSARRVRQLLTYDEDSAGGIMSTEYLSFPKNWTAGQVRNHLRDHQPSRIYYNLYVIDDDDTLIGWTTWQQLCLASGDTALLDLIPAKCPSVPVDMPQEEVAALVSDYDLTAVPVLNVEGNLVGTVTFDDIIDVIEEEASEDLLLQAGSKEEELHAPTVLKSARARIPWLGWTFVGGFGCFLFLSKQEQVLNKELLTLLMPFVPVTMAMGGNVGLQAATVSVRQLATGGMELAGIPAALWRETRVGVLVGLFFGILLSVGAGLLLERWEIAFVAAISMFGAVTISAVLGFFVPILFHRMRFDPALASGPLVTIINDLLVIVIFFSLAHLILPKLPSDPDGQVSLSLLSIFGMG